MTTQERWLPVVGYEGLYEVSDAGRVRNSKTRNTLSLGRKRCGRLQVGLRSPGRQRRWFLVHRLVLLAFVGPQPAGMECCHWDGDQSNNRLENLRWDTAAANWADRRRHGNGNGGDRAPKAKLTWEQVQEMRRTYARGGVRQVDLADEYGVNQSNVSQIVRGATWVA